MRERTSVAHEDERWKSRRKKRIYLFLVVAIDIALIFGEILMTHFRDIASMPPMLAMNAGIDIVVMI